MVTVRQRISDERIQDLLSCALEGGSNYWYRIVRYENITQQDRDSMEFPHLEVPFKGGQIIIEDLFDDFGEKILDRNAIDKGLELMSQNYRSHYFDFIDSNEDAITGDVFLQLCLYGEIIYG